MKHRERNENSHGESDFFPAFNRQPEHPARNGQQQDNGQNEIEFVVRRLTSPAEREEELWVAITEVDFLRLWFSLWLPQCVLLVDVAVAGAVDDEVGRVASVRPVTDLEATFLDVKRVLLDFHRTATREDTTKLPVYPAIVYDVQTEIF